MKIAELVNKNEIVIHPFVSVASIENELIHNAYLVIKNENSFIGLLTPSDVLVNGHNLVIDCYTKKPLINGNMDAESVMNMMFQEGLLVLPVVDDDNKYIGSVQVNTMIKEIWDIAKPNININWINVVDNGEGDKSKRDFSVELFHHTRNPVQVILSAVDMLRSAPGEFETKVLLSSIESSARLLDSLITKLYSFHFDKGGKVDTQ
jgi:CBS domain-containing protein